MQVVVVVFSIYANFNLFIFFFYYFLWKTREMCTESYINCILSIINIFFFIFCVCLEGKHIYGERERHRWINKVTDRERDIESGWCSGWLIGWLVGGLVATGGWAFNNNCN